MSKYNSHRRSLQSSFIFNGEGDNEDVQLEDRDVLTPAPTGMNSPIPGSSPTMNNWSMNLNNKRASLYSMNNNSNTSLNIQKNHHRRKSSAAAESYIPQQILPLPPQSQQPQSPFKFGSLNMSSESLNVPKTSYRRGHRYKHSSVSMNLFQEAPEAVVKNVPQTYAVPELKEVTESITKDQKLKIFICGLQLAVLIFTYVLGIKIEWGCLVTLSHVLFYDFISNLIIVIVQVLANFPIWKMSSLVYPFGLGRLEVLFSFGLSVSLLFVGLDLMSHIIEELVMQVTSIEESHHVHEHSNIEINFVIYELIILAVISISLFTSHTVNTTESQRQEISVVKRLSSITLNAPTRKPLSLRILNLLGLSIQDTNGKRNVMSSSTTLLTIIYSIYCMMYPLLDNNWVNEGSALGLSILILSIGTILIKRYGYTLLLGTHLDDVEKEISKNISQLDCYKTGYNIDSVKVSRVNHFVWIVIVEMSMLGSNDDEEAKMRFYATRVIRGVMSRAVNDENLENGKDERGNLLDLMSGGEATSDNSQFEITIDVTRL